MAESRHLAAIIFIDIVGFTSMMAASEEKAKSAVKSFKERAQPIVKEYEGTWHKDLGDGALCSFSSAKSAVLAATKIQQSNLDDFRLRMGVHLGDIIVEDGDIIGNGVNMASRLQSEATPGGICVSSSIQESLKNHPEVEFLYVGSKKIKGFNTLVKLFEVKAEGVVNSARPGRVLQQMLKTAIIYLVVGWLIIQGLTVLFPTLNLTKHQLSWAQLTILIGFPIAIIMTWAYGKGLAKKRNREVVAYSSSLAIVIIGIFTGLEFLGGSMTYDVVIEDDLGNKETVSILKEKFIPSAYLFSFENITDSSELDWIKKGIPQGISMDLGQFNYIYRFFLTDSMSLVEKVELAKSRSSEYMVQGSFDLSENGLEVSMELYQTSDLAEIASGTYAFQNVMQAADSLSLVLRHWMKIDPVIMKKELDLPLSSYTSEVEESYKYYVLGAYRNAVSEDSTFALAAAAAGSEYHYYQGSKLAASAYIEYALEHIDHLPSRFRNDVLISYYEINRQPDKALKLLNNQLKQKPGDLDLMNEKARSLRIAMDLEYIQVKDNISEKRRLTLNEQIEIITVLTINGQYKEAFRRINDYEVENPAAVWNIIKGIVHLAKFDLDEAETFFEMAKLQDPGDINIDRYVQTIEFARTMDKKSYTAIIKRFDGKYQYGIHELEIITQSYDYIALTRGANQSPFLAILQNDSTLFSYLNPPGRNQLHVQTIFKQDENGIHAIKKYQQNFWDNNPAWSDITWKIDPIIDSAKIALSRKEYSKAEKYFKRAQELYPNHFFLQEYVNHTQFITNEVFAHERLKFDKILGSYVDQSGNLREITFSDGTYFYGDVGMPRLVILPTSASTFTFLDSEEFPINEIIRENGIVTGFEARRLDSESMKIALSIVHKKTDKPSL